jgi:hypothetical protein
MPKFNSFRRVGLYLTLPRIVALLILSISAAGIAYYNQRPIDTLHAATVSTTSSVASTSTYPIPEFGIVLTLPSGLSSSDLVYSAQINRPVSAVDSNPWSTVSFSTKSLQQLDSACTADEGSIGMIVRYTEDPKAIKAQVSDSQQIGDHYFAFAAPQGSCSENPQAHQLESTQIGLLQQAFEAVKAGN